MYFEKQKKNWFYKTFICGHSFTGQIKVDDSKPTHKKHRHYLECTKCGKRVWID